MSRLEIEHVTKHFGSQSVIHDLTLTVEDGEFLVLVGPSGCGKSTLLRMIAGLEQPSMGIIRLDGRDVTRAGPKERNVGMVFQSYALYPHMNARQNIGFGLRMARVARSRISEQISSLSTKLRLDDYLPRKPRELSGGQRQRVAIGRAMIRNPMLFLLDEPLSNLDAALRMSMRLEIARLREQVSSTMVYVTHDQVEAMTLADRIVVMDHGRIAQVGKPMELYDNPANRFVAGFIGSPAMNFFEGQIVSTNGRSAKIALTEDFSVDVSLTTAPLKGEKVTVGIRPEHLSVADRQDAGDITLTADLVELLGSETFVHLQSPFGRLTVRTSGDRRITKGDEVHVSLGSGRHHIFDEAGARLS